MKKEKAKIIRRVILIVLAAIVILSASAVGILLFNAKPAVRTIEEYQRLYVDTMIRRTDRGDVELLPKNGGTGDRGIIFYVGAEIDPDAYIPLLSRLAEQGIPCYIPKLPLNMSPLAYQSAGEIIRSHPETRSWFLAGHSMGGLTASGFADDHRELIDGLIFLAAYSNRDMHDAGLPVLAILGRNDGVMNRELYAERLLWNPADFEEHSIPGANHAQFGDYGRQSGDLDAAITADEQQEQTAELILDWMDRRGQTA